MKQEYSIGQLAALSDCSVQLIRHYEGIIRPDRWDLIGGIIYLVGTGIILFVPRQS